jgi:hypothetical protein
MERRKTFVDCLADHVGQRHSALPESLRFPKAILVQPHIDQSRTHAVKIGGIYGCDNPRQKWQEPARELVECSWAVVAGSSRTVGPARHVGRASALLTASGNFGSAGKRAP